MVIATVDPGSPAEQAGLEPGDVITEINNQPINGPADLRAAIGGLHAGEAIEIQVNRGSTSYTTHATLATRPTSFP
jgi:S1-C subfamily serine protease